MPALIGTGPNQVPVNGQLGTAAFIDAERLPVSVPQKDALDAKANLASPTLTGTPAAPTAAVGTNTTQIATTAYVNAEIANDAAPIAHVGSGGAAHANAVAAGAAGFMTGADKSKLNGIASGATANATDAQLRDRSTHTGQQAISTVTGLQTALDAKLSLTGGTATGSIYARGSFGMRSSTISGNPIMYDVADQAGALVMELGRSDGIAATTAIDIHTGTGFTDYDTRLSFTGGTGVTGGGNFNVQSAGFTWNGATVALASSVTAKQDTLVSGTNIKTVNGQALPGSGDLEVGYRNIPQNSQSAAYTLVLSDAGKHILHPAADTTACTFTIPANSSVAFPIGTAITFINQNGTGGIVSIGITTDTMRLAGAGTTGTRTLARNGVATAVKITSTEWIISGTGLT